MTMRSSELLKKYDIRFKKGLGQNFLLDPNINRKMVDVAEIGPDDSVFEVGAGIGDLTQVLAERAGKVFTVEIDLSFESPLRERFGDNEKVRIFIGDVLNHSVEELVSRFIPDAKSLKMVSNLPYYITSPVLMHFLESDVPFVSLTVMVQKEVAERIVAAPGGKDYGILSIACQLYTRPYVVHAVSPKCFRPVPKVASAIVHLPTRRDLRLTREQRRVLFKILHAGFGQRRKKLINALSPLSGSLLPGKGSLGVLLDECGISPNSRAESIPVEAFIRLASVVAQKSSATD